MLAGVVRARETGEGCQLEIAQSDAAAAMDWLRSETWRAYERPESEVTGNEADNYERRAPGTAGMEDGVRYQFYASKDGHVLFMASEREFWKNFCAGVDRLDLFERWPGSQYGDHARGNLELRETLRDIFATRTSAEWIDFGREHNTPIAPANTPKTLLDDPQFQDRFPLIPAAQVGADMLPIPIKFLDEELPVPTKAPTVGEHTEAVLRTVLGWDETQIARALGRRARSAPRAAERGRSGPGREKARWERRGRAAIPGVPLPVLQGVRARRAGGGAPDPRRKIPAIRRQPNRGSQEIPGSPPEGYPRPTRPTPATGSSPNRTGRGVCVPAGRRTGAERRLDTVTRCRRAAPDLPKRRIRSPSTRPSATSGRPRNRPAPAETAPGTAAGDPRFLLAAPGSSSRSTGPGPCTGISAWSATACSRRGRCRRASRRTPGRTTSRSAPKITRSNT